MELFTFYQILKFQKCALIHQIFYLLMFFFTMLEAFETVFVIKNGLYYSFCMFSFCHNNLYFQQLTVLISE